LASSRKASRLLDLAREIVRREQELGRLRTEFARLAGEDAQLELPIAQPPQPVVVVAPLPPKRPSLARPSTLAVRITSLLDMNPRSLTASEIQMLLESADSLDTIRTTLSKLAGRGLIERVGPGAYRSRASGPGGGKRTA